jgi:hypothetical protein
MRLARAYISKESATGYSHSGAPTHLDLSRDMLERAWPKAEGSSSGLTGSANGWDAARFKKSLAGSTRAWVEFWYPYDDPAGTWGEEITWLKEGKERVLEEIAGILKDVVQEIESREDVILKLDEEEARTVGETLFQLAGYVLVLK